MARRSLFYLALLAPATTFAATVRERTDGPDLPPANPLPNGWSYTGCFADSPATRILNDAHMQDDNGLTGASCMAFCASNGYPYAGTEYASECYCGLTPPSNPTTGCNMGCTGNSTEACGGPGTITVYENPPLTPHVYPGNECWTSQGCYTDSPSARTLERRVTPPGPGVDDCLSTCKDQGFTWAGLEYGSECWCGNKLADTASITLDGCDMTCQGQVDEFCGGAGSLNAYKIADSCAPAASTTTTTTTGVTPSPSPICGASGYDLQQPAAGLSNSHATDYASCSAFCNTYHSFAFGSEQCLCYNAAVQGNFRSDANSPYTFYDHNCAAPTTTTTTSPTTNTTTTTTTTRPPAASNTTTTTRRTGWDPVTSIKTNPYTTTTTRPASTTTTRPASTTTTTTKSTTTTCTTTLKTTTTKAASTCPPSKPTGLIPNGGFESSSPFSWSSSSSGALSGYQCSKTGGYEGCKTYVISPNPGSSFGSRCHTLSMPSCVAPGSARALEFYLGRRTGAIPSAIGTTVTVSVGAWSQTVQVPSGRGCDLSGQNGTVWKKISLSVPKVSGSKNANLVVSVNWPAWSICNLRGGEDDVLIDGVNLW